jgi:quercetin dioxygenase-like cupin family protein
MFVKNAAAQALFSAGKMGKSTLASGDFIFAGLNAFEPGQEHAPHAHAGQDKLYVVLEGSGDVCVGEKSEMLSAGDVAFAPSGVTHSVKNTGAGRLVILAVLSPPPK